MKMLLSGNRTMEGVLSSHPLDSRLLPAAGAVGAVAVMADLLGFHSYSNLWIVPRCIVIVFGIIGRGH